MNYPRKNLIYLKQVYTFQSNQIKFENPKSSLHLKRFIVHFLTSLNLRKPKSQVKAHLLYLANSYFYNYKLSPRILRKNKDILLTSPDKRSGVVILDRRLYNNAIEEIISDTSKFEKLNEDPTLKGEASLQRFLRKLKQNNFFSENEYDKLDLLVLLLLVPMILLKFSNSQFANSPLVIDFLNFIRLFYL